MSACYGLHMLQDICIMNYRLMTSLNILKVFTKWVLNFKIQEEIIGISLTHLKRQWNGEKPVSPKSDKKD